MHTAEVAATLAEWRQGRARLAHYATDLLPLVHEQTQASVAAYAAGRADLRSTIDALSEEINTQLEYVELKGGVARAWAFLHLLHDSGASP